MAAKKGGSMRKIPTAKLFNKFSTPYGRNDVVITGPRLMSRAQFIKAVAEIKKVLES
jgi:hypothetical protein